MIINNLIKSFQYKEIAYIRLINTFSNETLLTLHTFEEILLSFSLKSIIIHLNFNNLTTELSVCFLSVN